ncbi:hypothetical protein HDU76_004185 [Blyttiomyces sp. JEL0837]|nr:hypothetical protein HDU76_004185 [Blyttiomyces sp. JEL0837]
MMTAADSTTIDTPASAPTSATAAELPRRPSSAAASANRAEDDDMLSEDEGRTRDRSELKTDSKSAAAAKDNVLAGALGDAAGGGRRGRGKPVDREKLCPFLIRVFIKTEGHHDVHEFSASKQPEGEIHVHTWKDATLRELASLLVKQNPTLQDPNVKISFRSIYPDQTRHGNGSYQSKPLGQLCNYRKLHDEERTLNEARFVIGDFVDVAVYLNANARERERERDGPMSAGGPVRGNEGRGIVGGAGSRFNPYARNGGGNGGAGGFGIRGRAKDFGGGRRRDIRDNEWGPPRGGDGFGRGFRSDAF